MSDTNVARVYLQQRIADEVVLSIGGTNYQLHLKAAGPVTPSKQGRVNGVIRLPVWKVDAVSAGGGAYIEPVYGKPRRVQGRIIATDAAANTVTVVVAGCPVVGVLPARWQAATFKPGAAVAMDILEGAAFEPAAAVTV